jgi:hypothetical protein
MSSAVYAPDIRTASDLSAQARAAAELAAATYRLNRYLPPQDNYSLSYQFDVGQIGLVDKAEYRAWDTATKPGRTGSGSSRAGKLPPLGRKYLVGEFEQLKLYNQGELLGAKLEEYARKGGLAIAARVALAQGRAIETGKVSLFENGLEVQIDYGRRPELTIESSILYSDPTAPIIDNFEAYLAVYRAINGANPGSALLSQTILSAMSKNQGIIREVVQRGSDLPTRVSYDDVRSVLSRYDVYGVEVYDQAIDGERILSANTITFLPSDGQVVLDGGVLGTTDWGITAESINPKYGISESERPGIFAAQFENTDPESSSVNTAAVAIPAVTNANATMSVKVLG